MKRSLPRFFVSALLLALATTAGAQTRSSWQMHDGLEVTAANPNGLVAFSCNPSQHGAICEYDVATVPPAADTAWRAAPDPDVINFAIRSRVCSAPVTCLRYGDFTYFQTFVDVPANVTVNTFTIAFAGMDDGSRVSIYNELYPGGLVVPGSYVYLGGSGTTNLAGYVTTGTNRVVVTQVDDCCSENNLRSATVVLNGTVVQTGCTVSSCDDGNPCTVDTCNADGTCGHTAASCDDNNACTTDSCDPVVGCVNAPVVCTGDACNTATCNPKTGSCESQPIVCNDNSACTTDSCDPVKGCVFTSISCDDGDPCTKDSCDPKTGCAHAEQCPDCTKAAATVATIWPPNHKFVGVGVKSITDPQGQPTTIRIDSVYQDEPTNSQGDGNTCVDAGGIGTSTAQVRAERKGTGDGRVYHILFTATDPDGNTCRGAVATCVPHDMGAGRQCVDQGPVYDSLVCSP